MDKTAARIMAAAREAARDYDLSERAYERLFSQLIALESALGNAAAMPHVDELLQLAIARETRLLDDPLLGLMQSGARIQKVAGAFIPPADDLVINLPNPSEGMRSARARSAPKMKQVVTILRRIGVHADDLFVYASDRPKGVVRQQPYTLIEIPRLDKQIAVTDAMGEAIFVSPTTLALETWSMSTKRDLVGKHGVARLVYDADGKWLAELHHALVGDRATLDPALHAKTILNDVAPLAILPEGAVLNWISQFFEKEGRYPSAVDATMWERDVFGDWYAVDGLSWQLVDAALRYGRRGLPGGDTLAAFKKRHGLFVDNTLDPDRLVRWIKLFYEKEGRYPTTVDRAVWDRDHDVWVRVSDENWNALSQALLQGVRGLGDYKGMALAQFRDAMLGRQLPVKLTPETVARWMMLFHEREGRYPFEEEPVLWDKDEADAWTKRGDISWANIHRCIRYGGRGLIEPMTVPEFRARYLGAVTREQRSEERVAAWIELFFEKEGRPPVSGRDETVWHKVDSDWRPVPGETWRGLNSYLMYSTRMRPRASRLTLARLAARLLDLEVLPPKGLLTEEKLLRWMKLHREKCGVYPQRTPTVVWDKNEAGDWIVVERENWRAIDSAIKNGGRGLAHLKGGSLSQLRRRHGLVDDPAPVRPSRALPRPRRDLS